MIIDKVVISLRDDARRSSFFGQPEAREFRVFEAVDGRRDKTDHLFDVEQCYARFGYRPTPGQMGCASSHWTILSEFAANDGSPDDLLLVSEDDSTFVAGGQKVLDQIVARKRPFDVMVLSDNWSLDPDPSLRAMLMASRQLSLLATWFWSGRRTYRLGRYSGAAWSAGLYLVSRRGARKWVSAGIDGRTFWVADDWGQLRSLANLDVAILAPSLVQFRNDSTTSSSKSQAAQARWREAAGSRTWLDHLALRSRARSVQHALAATVADIRARFSAAAR